MNWLPSSAEGKQLFGLGIVSLVLALMLTAMVHYFLALRVHREKTLADQAAVLRAVVDRQSGAAERSALLTAASSAGPPLNAFVVDGQNVVRAAPRAELVGQTVDAAETLVLTEWPNAARVRLPLSDGGALYVMAPLQAQSDLAARLAVGFAGSLLLGLIALPFFVVLTRNWINPLHRIVEANRVSTTGKLDPVIVPPASMPPGALRELVTHRNHTLELLRSQEEALSRRTGEMEILYEFSKQMGLSREAPDIPDVALTFLARSVDYDVACMLVFSDDQRSVTIRSRGPLSEFLAADVERLAVEAHYEKSGILLENEKLDTSQAVLDVRAPRLDGKFRTAHWAPITVERKQCGVMGVLALADRHFSADAVRFLNILAQNTSLALEKLHVMRIEEAQRFRNVLEHLAEGVVLVRQGGEWALHTGPSRQFHSDICGPEGNGTADHAHQCPIGLLGLDVFHGGKSISREITRHERTFILNGTYVRSSAAGESGAVVSIRDVTEERATQQQLFQASKLASLGELAAGVAHEVNNPLTGILGFTELLMSRDDISAPVLDSLKDIHGLARRTAQITMDLLIFARVQREEGGFQGVDLKHVVRDTMKLLETTYRNLNLELTAELGGEDVKLIAVGDQGKIQQIVLNLAQNAKDAITMASKGSKITFRGYREKDDVVLEIRDDGPGIPDRIRSKIFEPFYTTKPVGKGTGLGLAIVNRIVEEHKGKLLLESEEGQGTRFKIVLPAASAEQIAKLAEAAPRGPSSPPRAPSPVKQVVAVAAKANGDRGTVVVLDDEETVLKFLSKTLERDGLVVHATSDPTVAFGLIDQHNPDLLFLDFRMPDTTGEEFYNEVVAKDPSYARRVIFLTGDATGDEIQGFLKATGAPALTKPIGIRDLREFVGQKLAENRGDTPAA